MEMSLFKSRKKDVFSFFVFAQKQIDIDRNVDKRNMLGHRRALLCEEREQLSKVDENNFSTNVKICLLI